MKYLLILAAAAASALAGPIPYTIHFNLLNGTLTPTGSFTYDAAAAPDSRFSSFLVVINGVTLDFTGAANLGPSLNAADPNPCGTVIDSASTFAMLNGTLCGAGGSVTWDASWVAGPIFFTLKSTDSTSAESRNIQASAFFQTPAPFFPLTVGAGTLSISGGSAPPDTGVPEPSTLTLFAMGGASALAAMRKRR